VTDLFPPSEPGGAVPSGEPAPESAAAPAAASGSAEPFPWEGEPPPEEEFDSEGRRVRHDAFTARRRHDFLKALAKGGCVEDACRAVGVSPATVYRHQNEDESFRRLCGLAARMCAVPVELTAWERAVDGVEQEFACGGEVHVRRRYSDGLLRLLLQGSNPRKYGARPGFTRKRLLKFERKRMEKEIKAELRENLLPIEKVRDEVLSRLDRMREHGDRRRLAAGWTRSPDGHWIPPGYAPIDGWSPPTPEPPDGETPRDSV